MGFHAVKLPDDISYGFQAGPSATTVVQTTASGHEYRISRQAQMRRRFRASKVLMSPEQWSELLDFFYGRRGALHGFRFKDWTDYTTAEDGVSAPGNLDVVIGTGDGATQTFQLIKNYDFTGPAPYARTITCPVSGTAVCAVAGVSNTNFTLNANTGVVTFNSAPAVGEAVTAGCEFDVPVRMSEATEQWMQGRYDNFQLLGWEDFELVEVLDEVEWADLWWPGGSAGNLNGYLQVLKDSSMDTQTKVWPMDPVGSRNVFLPPPDDIPGGEVFVVIIKAGATGTVQLRDDAGNVVGSALGAGAIKRIALLRSGSSAVWVSY